MKLLSSLFILLHTIALVAQPPTKFYHRWGGEGYDVAYDIKQTLDNGYIILGSTSSFGQGNTDMYLTKLDSLGQKKFEKSFGGPNNEIGKSVLQLADSSYVMIGYTSSIGVGGYDIFLVKADKAGNLLWQKTIGGNDWDFAYSLKATSDGGFIIAGTTYSFGHGNADGYIVKTDANGNITWSKTYGGANDDEFKSIIQTDDGGYALTGYTKSYNDVLGDAWLFKVDVHGDSLKSFSYNFGLNDAFNDIKQLSTGDYVTAGYLTFNNNQKRDGVFNKITTNGTIVIHTTEGQAGSDEEFFKVDTSNSSFGIYTVLGNSHEHAPSYKTDVKLLLLNIVGGYVNGGSVGSYQDDECFSFCLTKERSKGYIAAGYTKSYNSVLSDFFIIKYDSLLSIGTSIIGISEINNSHEYISVYPNPFCNKISLALDNIKMESVELFSIQGDRICYFNALPLDNSLDLSFLENGIYIIRLTDKNHHSFVQKLIKSN